jgi:hypothetical protein
MIRKFTTLAAVTAISAASLFSGSIGVHAQAAPVPQSGAPAAGISQEQNNQVPVSGTASQPPADRSTAPQVKTDKNAAPEAVPQSQAGKNGTPVLNPGSAATAASAAEAASAENTQESAPANDQENTQKPMRLDIEAISAAIENLGEDNENYSNLISLLDAYKTAVSAEDNTSEDTDETTLDSLHDATAAAAEALLSALKDAGIELPAPSDTSAESASTGTSAIQSPTADSAVQAKPAAGNAVISSDNTSGGSENDVIEKMINWLKSLLKKS